MPERHTDNKSILVQVMAWCRRASLGPNELTHFGLVLPICIIKKPLFPLWYIYIYKMPYKPLYFSYNQEETNNQCESKISQLTCRFFLHPLVFLLKVNGFKEGFLWHRAWKTGVAWGDGSRQPCKQRKRMLLYYFQCFRSLSKRFTTIVLFILAQTKKKVKINFCVTYHWNLSGQSGPPPPRPLVVLWPQHGLLSWVWCVWLLWWYDHLKLDPMKNHKWEIQFFQYEAPAFDS